jgi:hypothetical protein
MKSGRKFLIIGIMGSMVFVQGLFASRAFGEEPNSAASEEPNGPPPKISFDQTIHDFGLVSPGSSQTCEFNFKNRGLGVLVIKDVTKTCGCTPFKLAKKEYAPGETGTLTVSYHADKGNGIRTRHLYVFSNDPENPRVELTIRASIAQKVVFEPDRLEYKLKGDNADVAELTIHSMDEKPFAVTKYEATADAVTVNFDPDQKDAKLVLQTRLDPQKIGPSTNGRIVITITHPECSSITVPFTVLSKYRLDPPAINVLDAVPGKKIQRDLWVLDNYDEDFEIISITSKQDIVKVVGQEKLGNRYKISLEILPPEKKATRMFTDTLTLTMKDGEQIRVTCRGFFRRK